MGIGIGAVRPMAAFKPFLPSDSAALALWLRANTTSYVSGTTQAVDTETLSSWLDSVGSKSFAQATSGSRPMYAVLEGKPAVRLAGINRTNCLVYTGKVFGNSTSFTLSIACRIPDINTVTSAIYSEANSADTSDLLQISCYTDGTVRVNLRDSADHVVNANSTSRIDDNKVHVVTVVVDSGNLQIYVDGSQEYNADYAATVTGWTSATFNRSTIGAKTSTTTLSYLQADIFEIVGYAPALSASALASHHAYLIAKYSGIIPAVELVGFASGQAVVTSAVRKSGKSYFGSYNFDKQPQVTVVDHGVSPATKLSYVINTGDNGGNFHDSTAIAFTKAGRILAFYGDHNTAVLNVSKSTNVLDPTAWATAVDIGPDTTHGYPQAITTTEGANSWRNYIFYRNQTHGCWKFRYSDDTDAATPTWAAAQTLWQPQGDTDVQIYMTARLCSDGNIHFTASSNDVEPGPAGGTDLYHWMYKPADGKWYKSDGTTEITSLPFDTSDATKVYDSSDHGTRNPSNKQDIMVSGGNIYVAIGTSDRVNGTTEGRLVRAVYSSGSWTIDEAVDVTPNSWPYPSFSNSGPDVIYYPRSVSGLAQLYRATLSGATWTVDALTSGPHFTSTAQGSMRVDGGVEIDMAWYWGANDDSNFAYGQLSGYPAVT